MANKKDVAKFKQTWNKLIQKAIKKSKSEPMTFEEFNQMDTRIAQKMDDLDEPIMDRRVKLFEQRAREYKKKHKISPK